MDLPIGPHEHYCGIDPGFKGAISVMNAAGTVVSIVDLPVTSKGTGKSREFDLPALRNVFKRIKFTHDLVVGLEWPTTRPGEGAERSERFGRGKGILQAMLFCMGFDYYLISPNLWKGRLGVPGKTQGDSNIIAEQVFTTYYPQFADLIKGPRGGFKDGRCDAALIAHFLRTRSVAGLKSIVEKHGRDSAEAMAFVLGGGRSKTKKFFRRP